MVRWIYRIAALSALLIADLACASALNIDAAQTATYRIISRSDSSVSLGSGFHVSGTRLVLTNRHVVEGGKEYQLGYMDGNRPMLVRARVKAVSLRADLALLEAELDLRSKPVSFSNTPAAKLLEITAIGFPGAADIQGEFSLNDVSEPALLDPTITTGIVSRRVTFADDVRGVQHTAAINSGNSGGPLFDNCGRVIGINTFKAFGSLLQDRSGNTNVNTVEGIYFAISFTEIASFLEENAAPISVEGSSCNASAQNSFHPISYVLIVFAIALSVYSTILVYRKKELISAPVREIIRSTYKKPIARSPGSASLKLRLVPLSTDDVSKIVDLTVLSCGRPRTVGRDRASDIRIDCPTVSRRHAEISYDASRGQLVVVDLGSTNGTFVNGKYRKNSFVAHDDIVSFGRVQFRADIQA